MVREIVSRKKPVFKIVKRWKDIIVVSFERSEKYNMGKYCYDDIYESAKIKLGIKDMNVNKLPKKQKCRDNRKSMNGQNRE